MFPYLEWHSGKGWKPIGVYARRGDENLRLSDLEHMTEDRKRLLVERLRNKIAALQGGPADALDVMRFFARRAGRAAHVFEGADGGRAYFHGMLHEQNISLLGEIVDLGKGRFVEGQDGLRAAFAKSVYVGWKEADRRGASSESELLRSFAHELD